MGEFAVCEVPVFVLALVLHGVAQLIFPVGLHCRNLVLRQQFLAFAIVFRPRRHPRANLAGKRRRNVHLLFGIEEGCELVELLLGDGVVLMVVALRAPHREPQPDGSQRSGAVQHLFVAKLLGVGAAFAIRQGIAVEAGGHQHFLVAARQQIAGNLLDGELVERQIAIERFDHPLPVAPRPGTRAVLLVAVAIGVTRQVQPVAAPLFAIVRRIEQPVHQVLVGIRPIVAEKIAHLVGRWRKAGEIEADPPDERRFGGFRRRRDGFRFQLRQHEIVDGIAGPRAIAHRGRVGTRNFLERPVRRPRRRRHRRRHGCGRGFGPFHALVDPPPQQPDLRRGQARAPRRHHLLIGRHTGYQADQPAAGAVMRNDYRTGSPALQRSGFLVKPQAAHLLPRPVAHEAALFEQRGDVPREVNLGRGGRRQTIVRGRQKRNQRDQSSTGTHPRNMH